MTMNTVPGTPVDPAPLYARYGQIPSWYMGYQELVYRCPLCNDILHFWAHPRVARKERGKTIHTRQELAIFQEAFDADFTRIPCAICPRCSFARYGAEFQVLEQVVDGRHLGYFFRYIAASGPQSFMQVRRYSPPGSYQQDAVSSRWPDDREQLRRMVIWLGSGSVSAAAEAPQQTIHHVERLGGDILTRFAYDIYDGQSSLRPLHWEGHYFRTETDGVYDDARNAEVSFALTIAAHSGKTMSLAHLARRWHLWINLLGNILQESPM